MLPLRVFAVDDEELALRRMELLLARVPEVELVGTARGAEEALCRLAKLKPDVLLVDVRMAGANGFELVEALSPGLAPQIIFATAFDHFAAQAFNVSAVDFLVKPIELDRLRRSLSKARRAMAAADADTRVAELRAIVDALREQARPASTPRWEREIWAERHGDFHPVRVSDIQRIEAERDYVRLHTADHTFLLRETLSNMETRLSPEEFIRVRRSELVRRDCIQAIRKAGYGDFRLRLSSGQELRVGTTFVKQIRTVISGWRRRAVDAASAEPISPTG